MDDDSADDGLTESELSSEDDFKLEDVNAPWNKQKKHKLRNSYFYHKMLCSTLVFLCSPLVFIAERPMYGHVLLF